MTEQDFEHVSTIAQIEEERQQAYVECKAVFDQAMMEAWAEWEAAVIAPRRVLLEAQQAAMQRHKEAGDRIEAAFKRGLRTARRESWLPEPT